MNITTTPARFASYLLACIDWGHTAEFTETPPRCDCGDRHRWDCDTTPLWAQTVRDLGTDQP
jgi:hypothetical protein